MQGALMCKQGAKLMSKYGINVPKGAAVGSLDGEKKVLKDIFPKEKEVGDKLFF